MNDTFMKEKPIFPLLVSMALPMVISMLVNALYNIVDSLFVAQISEDAMTALSLVYPVQNLVNAIAIGFGVGINAQIALHLGAGEHKKANMAATHGLMLSLLHGVVITVVSILIMPTFLRMFTSDETVIRMGVTYSRIAFLFSTVIMATLAFEKIFQAVGRMRVTMVGLMAGSVCNIILDPMLIFGIGPFPELGIRGAALATVIGQIFGMALGLWGVFRHQKVLNVNMKAFKWNRGTVGDIYRVGLPGIVMQSVVSVMTAGMNGILIAFSQTAVNVLGVYFKLQTFVFMPVFGLNQGALPVMGYNYGARNRRRLMGAYRITLTAAVVIMALGLVLFQLLPEQMLMLFVDRTDAAAAQEMIEVGVPALKTISLSFLGAAFGIINSTLFQATARGMNSLIVSVCRQLVVILPAAWILGQQFGLNAVWYAFPIAEVASFFISYILLWREYRTELRFLGTEKEKKA